MKLLPSGNSIWSLIENQDLSATTNRIDVGGLWNGIPGLFSARGSASWTQNEYRLNGMSVTDPYSGGFPLLYPDFLQLPNGPSGERRAFLPDRTHRAEPSISSPRTAGTDIRGPSRHFTATRVLSSSNITPALRKEGLMENHTLNDSLDVHFDLSGPLVPGKLFFFTSWTGSNSLPEHRGFRRGRQELGVFRPGQIEIRGRTELLVLPLDGAVREESCPTGRDATSPSLRPWTRTTPITCSRPRGRSISRHEPCPDRRGRFQPG